MAKPKTEAQKEVEKAIHEAKEGELTVGRSKKKVSSRKQAIAIGLDKARRKGAKVPPPPHRTKRRKAK